ncbi:MAG: HAMP domain-containing sensor histidine kinase [Myxococcota bacterium]
MGPVRTTVVYAAPGAALVGAAGMIAGSDAALVVFAPIYAVLMVLLALWTGSRLGGLGAQGPNPEFRAASVAAALTPAIATLGAWGLPRAFSSSWPAWNLVLLVGVGYAVWVVGPLTRQLRRIGQRGAPVVEAIDGLDAEPALVAIDYGSWTGGLAFLAVAALVGFSERVSDTSLALAVLAAAITAVLAAGVGYRDGARFFADLDEATARVTQAGLAPGREEVDVTGVRTAAVLNLLNALNYASQRLESTAAEETRAAQSIEELQATKTRFLASMSHDLRSPLNAILGFSELLQDAREELTDAQRTSVKTIARSGEELLTLLNNVLDSARLAAGRLVIRREWTPSVEILTEAVRRGQMLVEGAPLEIQSELQPGLPPVYVDRERIVQAVLCLFAHAVRAMDQGTIQLIAEVAYAEHDESQVRVAVIDRSKGIRVEDAERIFQAFRKIAEPSGRRIGGLGLGLALAKDLVNAHGGDIWADSKPHQGTTFTVAIPTDGPEPEPRRRR